jgi:hypothetical protein
VRIVRFAGQRQQLHVLVAAGLRIDQRRLERVQRFLAMAAAEQAPCQHLARVHVAGRAFEVMAEVVLGQVIGAELEVDDAGQQHAGHVLGRDPQHLQQRVVRCLDAIARKVEQGLGICHQHAAGRQLERGVQLGLGHVVALQADRRIGLLDVGGAVLGLQRQHLVVDLEGLLGLVLCAQQLGLNISASMCFGSRARIRSAQA